MFEQSPPISEVDVLESPDVVAAELATSLPRAEDMSALLMLDTETLSDAGRVDLLVAFERHIALLQAAQQQAVSAADPRRAEQRHDDAVAQRRVVFTQQDDGITELWALLPADGAALIEAVLNSLGSAQTDSRTGDQRGADALVDVFARVLGDPSLPEAHGQRPAISITVQLSTLLSCDEQPADLDGYGPSHRGDGPPPRRGPVGYVAAAGHRRHRPTPRLRPQNVPTTGEPHRPRHRPRPSLHLPRMPTCSQAVRPRSCRGLDRRRRHEPRERRRPLRQTPQRKALRRLAGQTPTGRCHRVGQSTRKPLRRACA